MRPVQGVCVFKVTTIRPGSAHTQFWTVERTTHQGWRLPMLCPRSGLHRTLSPSVGVQNLSGQLTHSRPRQVRRTASVVVQRWAAAADIKPETYHRLRTMCHNSTCAGPSMSPHRRGCPAVLSERCRPEHKLAPRPLSQQETAGTDSQTAADCLAGSCICAQLAPHWSVFSLKHGGHLLVMHMIWA